jgi:hypothetical protein
MVAAGPVGMLEGPVDVPSGMSCDQAPVLPGTNDCPLDARTSSAARKHLAISLVRSIALAIASNL